MKRKLLLLCTVISFVMTGCCDKTRSVDIGSCKGNQVAVCTVIGEIQNVKDGYQMLLFKSNLDGSNSTIAVDTLENGRFEFTAPAETGVQYHIATPHFEVFPSMSVDFYVEPGAEIRIIGKDYLIKNWKVKSRVRDQKIYQSYYDQVADIYKEMQLEDLEYRKTKDLERYLDNSKVLHSKTDSVLIKWLKSQRKITEPWMDLMYSSSHAAKMLKDEKILTELRGIWGEVDESFRNTPKGKRISMSLQISQKGPLKVGDLFPYDMDVYDIHGYYRSLSEFKGKYLLLYFNSYGCKPCIEAKKELAELTDSMKGTLEVIGLNVDTPDTWKAKGKDNPVPWYDFNEEKEWYGLNLRFETMGVPAFVIISKDGEILDIWSGYREGIITERINRTIFK